jgi:hypothetical protein
MTGSETVYESTKKKGIVNVELNMQMDDTSNRKFVIGEEDNGNNVALGKNENTNKKAERD